MCILTWAISFLSETWYKQGGIIYSNLMPQSKIPCLLTFHPRLGTRQIGICIWFPNPFRQISSRPGPARANHFQNGAGLTRWLTREAPYGSAIEAIFINNQDGCRWCVTCFIDLIICRFVVIEYLYSITTVQLHPEAFVLCQLITPLG